jgi:hypothetical protein
MAGGARAGGTHRGRKDRGGSAVPRLFSSPRPVLQPAARGGVYGREGRGWP